MKDDKSELTKKLNEIESDVYQHLKPLGFRKHGRALHRFVSEDISQVVEFQAGMWTSILYGTFCVNLGIRVPECDERRFQPQKNKKFYHEYECNIRSRLGTMSGKEDTWYDLKKDSGKIAEAIIGEIDEHVLPVFDVLCSREAILAHRRDYPLFDHLNSRLILLEESMIYGHLGNMDKAKESFEEYYRNVTDKYETEVREGKKVYLKKGARLRYLDQDITAEKDGYVTVYGASRSHIDYLDKLALDLGLR